jgi:hypothetical protein
MDNYPHSEERPRPSPGVPHSNISSNSLPSYQSIRPKSCPPQPQNLPNLFQRNFKAKYASPIISRASTLVGEDDEKQPKPTRFRAWISSVQHLLIDWWLAEVLLWLISACCIFSIIIILGIHDGAPLPNHWTWNISLNTRLAILSTLAKFTLSVPIESSFGQLKWHWFGQRNSRSLIDLEHFDKASRGPWGSFLFVLRMRCKFVTLLFPFPGCC